MLVHAIPASPLRCSDLDAVLRSQVASLAEEGPSDGELVRVKKVNWCPLGC